MKQVTRWHPDTCDCVIDFSWDDSIPPEERTHTQETVVSKCAAHSTGKASTMFNTLLGENQHKNRIIGHVATVLGVSDKEAVEATKYSFDSTRKLSMNVKGLDAGKLTQLTSLLDADPDIDTTKGGRLKSITAG